MFGVGASELFVILCVAILLIKPRDLPKVFRSLGRLYSRFRAYLRELQSAQERFFYDIQKEAAGGEAADPPYSPYRENDDDISKVGKIDEGLQYEKIPFGLEEPDLGVAEHFIGKSHLEPLNLNEVNIFSITLEPGCRSSWHIRHGGARILFCTDGEGWFQEEGRAARRLVPGDVVYVKPEVRHWLGAGKEVRLVHLSIEVPARGGTTEWLEPVGEAHYLALGKPKGRA